MFVEPPGHQGGHQGAHEDKHPPGGSSWYKWSSTGFVQAIFEGKDGKATHSQQTLQVPSHACLLFPAILIEMWCFVGSGLHTPYSFEWGELREIPSFSFRWAALHASAFFLLYYFHSRLRPNPRCHKNERERAVEAGPTSFQSGDGHSCISGYKNLKLRFRLSVRTEV
jgi:hypothetical protein